MRLHKKIDTLDPLDRTDRAILRPLQRDASISNVALAEQGQTEPGRLSDGGSKPQAGRLDQGHRRALDKDALDAGMVVLIGVGAGPLDAGILCRFEKAAQKVSGCMECHVVTGEFDYFMLIRTKDSKQLQPPARGAIAVPARRAADPFLHGSEAGALYHADSAADWLL